MTTMQYLILGILVLFSAIGGTFMIVRFTQLLTRLETEAHNNNKNIELGMFWVSIFAIVISIMSLAFSLYQNDKLSNIENRLKQIEIKK